MSATVSTLILFPVASHASRKAQEYKVFPGLLKCPKIHLMLQTNQEVNNSVSFWLRFTEENKKRKHYVINGKEQVKWRSKCYLQQTSLIKYFLQMLVWCNRSKNGRRKMTHLKWICSRNCFFLVVDKLQGQNFLGAFSRHSNFQHVHTFF